MSTSAIPDCSSTRDVSLECFHCQQAFQVPCWELADLRVRQDLAQQARAGHLNRHLCPSCAHAQVPDLAFMVLLGEGPHPLILCPAEHTTTRQDRRDGRRLLELLQHKLGGAWQDPWLQQMAFLPRSLLPMALGSGVQQALGYLRVHGPYPQQEAVRRAALAALVSYRMSGSSGDEELAIHGLARAVAAPDAPQDTLWELRWPLGQLLWERYRRVDDPTDLYGAIDALSQALEGCPAERASADLWEALGMALTARHQRTGNKQDLRAAQEAARRGAIIREQS